MNDGLFKIDQVLGFLINRASIVFRKELTNAFKENNLDLTPETFALLSRLWEEDGISQQILTEKTLKDKTRVTRLLGKLMENQLIFKKNNEADKRNYNIYLTSKGLQLREQIIPLVLEVVDKAKEGIKETDIEITSKTLNHIIQNLSSEV